MLDPNTKRLLDHLEERVHGQIAKLSDRVSKIETAGVAAPAPAKEDKEIHDRLSKLTKMIQESEEEDKSIDDRLKSLEQRMKNIEVVIGKLHKSIEGKKET